MLASLAAIPRLSLSENVPLSSCTRFGIGGPARLLVDAGADNALAAAMAVIRSAGTPWALIGGGTNLVADDAGFSGVVLRYTAAGIRIDGTRIAVQAGALLQALVDSSIQAGLRGLETMTGIPGWVGGAIYGNAGAYGHSIAERVVSVRYFDGECVRELSGDGCEFQYRESIFKRHKDWIVLEATLRLDPADAAELARTAEGILKIRNAKYPPAMRCAGSIFKNLFLTQLAPRIRSLVPGQVIREGKVPSAYFLEQVGAKGITDGGIRVADYHANLVYNTGGGTSGQVAHVVGVLKQRVRERFGLELEEEVQYLADA
jgi:UDP-N-acetylmuramate dehydrogenase